VALTVERYVAPRSLDEALEVLRLGDAMVLAGGTTVMPLTKSGKALPHKALVSIRRVPELTGIALTKNEVRIGALTTITELKADAFVRKHFPMLVAAGDHFGSEQIRNVGTLGGNVCNASPGGGPVLSLLVLDASVELARKPNGSVETRTTPLKSFFAGTGGTHREPGELVVAIRIPLPPADHIQRFYKFSTRPALDNAAILIGLAAIKAKGVLRHVRLAYGAVAPVPMRGAKTEAVLEGKKLTAELIEQAARAAHDEVKPISDVRASDWYRRELIYNIVKRMLADVHES
jgi:CO/xanthine dehydrogenase FAD-binding subunit